MCVLHTQTSRECVIERGQTTYFTSRISIVSFDEDAERCRLDEEELRFITSIGSFRAVNIGPRPDVSFMRSTPNVSAR